MNVLIENTSASVTGISNIVLRQGFQSRNVILRPGINTVDSEIWDSMKNVQVIKNQIEKGILKIALDGKDADDVSEAINHLHYTQANKIIKATFDLNLLNKWQENETRSAVLKAIETQIKQLEIPVSDNKTEMFL